MLAARTCLLQGHACCKDMLAVDTRKLTTKTFTKLPACACRYAVFHNGLQPRAPRQARASDNGSARDPAHARDLAAGIADARERCGDRLDRNRHVKSVGVNEGRAVAHDRHVAFPEDEVAAL